jgi:hypothetical protein
MAERCVSIGGGEALKSVCDLLHSLAALRLKVRTEGRKARILQMDVSADVLVYETHLGGARRVQVHAREDRCM